MFDIRKDFPARDEHWSELKWLNCGLSFSLPLTLKRFESNGGDNENRTRDLWRDRLDVIHWRMQNQQFTRASVGSTLRALLGVESKTQIRSACRRGCIGWTASKCPTKPNEIR
jgi:hypothetical protein